MQDHGWGVPIVEVLHSRPRGLSESPGEARRTRRLRIGVIRVICGSLDMKRIAILGSTGSIGTSALDVARTHADRVDVVAIAAATNVAAMVKQIIEFRPRAVAMATAEAMDKLTAVLGGSPAEISGVGNEGLCEIASHPDVDI